MENKNYEILSIERDYKNKKRASKAQVACYTVAALGITTALGYLNYNVNGNTELLNRVVLCGGILWPSALSIYLNNRTISQSKENVQMKKTL